MKNFRLWFPVTALAALMAAGCMLVSGQFIVTFDFADHGFDPLLVDSPTALGGVQVNLNDVDTYADHKDELKDVADLALVGKVSNLTGTDTAIEVWMVASPGVMLTTDAAVRAAGQRIWGSLQVPANSSVQIDWNRSAALFGGRQALIAEIKGDGRFDLYALGTGSYDFRIDQGALIAVISAGK
jgi:hypothetical protein